MRVGRRQAYINKKKKPKNLFEILKKIGIILTLLNGIYKLFQNIQDYIN